MGVKNIIGGLTLNGKEVATVDQISGSSEGLEYTLNDKGTEYSVTGIGSCTDTHVVIPGKHNGLPVTRIGAQAFKSCTALTGVEIPESVKYIEQYAFHSCGLKTLTIPDSVIQIGLGAIYNCKKLDSLVIPFVGEKSSNTSNTHFGYIYGAPTWSDHSGYIPVGLSKVTITRATTLADNAFSYCYHLTEIILPDNFTSAGAHVFNHCGYETIGSIPTGAPYNIYHGARYIGSKNNPYMLLVSSQGTNITSCVIPDSTRQICASAFAGCKKLQRITIPRNVRRIGSGAFYNCAGLKRIEIPWEVDKVDAEAFKGCSKLSIYCEHRAFPVYDPTDWLGQYWDDNWNPDNRPVTWGYTIPSLCVNDLVSELVDETSNYLITWDAENKCLVNSDLKASGGTLTLGETTHQVYTSYLTKDQLYLAGDDNGSQRSEVNSDGTANFIKCGNSPDSAANYDSTSIRGAIITSSGTRNGPPVQTEITPEQVHVYSDYDKLGEALLTRNSLKFVDTQFREDIGTVAATGVLTANSLHLGKDSTLTEEPTITLGTTTITESQLKALLDLLGTAGKEVYI
jgi:hypothetical protein